MTPLEWVGGLALCLVAFLIVGFLGVLWDERRTHRVTFRDRYKYLFESVGFDTTIGGVWQWDEYGFEYPDGEDGISVLVIKFVPHGSPDKWARRYAKR